jgi:hypothetical protein
LLASRWAADFFSREKPGAPPAWPNPKRALLQPPPTSQKPGADFQLSLRKPFNAHHLPLISLARSFRIVAYKRLFLKERLFVPFLRLLTFTKFADMSCKSESSLKDTDRHRMGRYKFF